MPAVSTPTLDLRAHFTRALSAAPGRLHFAAHSHHLWPDVSFDAQQQAWLDAARWADTKWERVFGELIPRVQAALADELGLGDGGSVVFAPNTHELVVRLLSCLPDRPTVLTTDAEFHSLERQLRRLEEDGLATVVRVPTEPFVSFAERFGAEARRLRADLMFLSHVFFNSGAVVQDLPGLVRSLPADGALVLDGYHGFCAVPTDLAPVKDRSFYVAGGYKYAMAGEGACFLHVPDGFSGRPRNTGWFAAFGALEEKAQGRVPFAPRGGRFWGATFDPSGLYRLDAVLAWRKRLGLTTAKTRAHAHALQQQFVAGLSPGAPFSAEQLVVPLAEQARGQFLTFRTEQARALAAALLAHDVVVDARDDRLRFGFGVYQTAADVDALHARLRRL